MEQRTPSTVYLFLSPPVNFELNKFKELRDESKDI